MKRNTLFSFLTIAALGLLTAGPASVNACTFTWKSDASTNVWRTAANWETDCGLGHDLPVAGDTVVIQATTNDNDPVISNDEIFLTLTINQSGVLTVTGANTLTLTGSSHTLDGDLVLQDNDSIVKFTADVTVDGRGAIIGQDNGAKIEIADNKTLTNQMVIKGKMTIKEANSSGTFLNGATGKVWANVAGTLLLEAGLTLSNCSTAVWAASEHGDARLLFKEDATGLTGLFYLNDCATIKLDANVDIATTNTLTNGAAGAPKGFLVVGSGGSFSYRDECDGEEFILDEDTTFGNCS